MSAISEYEMLIYRTKRRTREDGLTPEERIALNVYWRDGVRIPILARIFGVSKNTIYYKALTGEADSYPNSNRSNSAAETNALVERLGVEEARRRFVTPRMQAALEDELRREARRRERRRK
jgi:transposase